MRKKRGRAKSLICVVVACVMALSLMPMSSAMAMGDLQSWVAPSSKTATSYVQDGKTYTYITSSARKVSESTADVLGISNVTVCPTAGNPFTYQGTADAIYESIKTNARFGIYGSDVNQNMNPYYANYFYNQYQQTSAVQGTDLADTRATVLVDQRLNPGAPSAALTTVATEFGTSPTLYYRPDILYGVTSLTNADGQAVSYGASTTSISGYTDLVNKIRNRELGEYEGNSLYQEGDENYDPYYVTYDMTSFTGSIIDNLYSLGNAAEAIIQRTASTSNPKVTRYEDPLQIAGDYEAYLRGTQYAVLAAIDNGRVERKTAGIVKAADPTENTVTFMPTNIAGKDTNDYPEFIEAVTDDICSVNSIEGGVGTAKDLLDCDVVYIYGYNGMTNGNTKAQETIKDNLIQILKNYGATDESAYPEINVAGPKTVIHHDRGGSVENTVLLGSLIGFAYPEVVNPVYSLAYFYENFYHIKDSRLQDALGLNLASMTLPAGVELSLEGYNEADYQVMLAEGIEYYNKNKEAIDATYPKLAATSGMTQYKPVPVAAQGLAYTGSQQTGVAAGDYYTVTGNTATEAGAYTAIATANDGYVFAGGTTTVEIPWAIARARVATPVAVTGLVYNGSQQTGVVAGTGYTLAGNVATEAGSYIATATPDANHAWTNGSTSPVSLSWRIAMASVASATIAPVDSQAFTGQAIEPALSITWNGVALTEGKDFTVSFNNNVNVGTATAIVKGTGDYTGSTYTTFVIDKAANNVKPASVNVNKSFKAAKLSKSAQKFALPKVTTSFGTAKWKVSTKDKKGALSLKNSNKVQVKKGTTAGTYTMKLKASVAESENYAAATSKVVTVKVTVK